MRFKLFAQGMKIQTMYVLYKLKSEYL